MLLLDFCPEIFVNIVHAYVDDVGIDEAWRRREVCKSFRHYIELDIFLNQPLTAFQTSKMPTYPSRCWASKFFRNNPSLVLHGRMNRVLDANPGLPNALNRVVDYIADIEEYESEADRKNIALRLCESVTAKHGWTTVWDMLTDGVQPWTKRNWSGRRQGQPATISPQDQAMANNLVAAVYFASEVTLRACLSNGAKLWTPSNIFGYSLTAAATHHSLHDMLPLVLENMPRRMTQKMDGMREIHCMFNDAVMALFKGKSMERSRLIALLRFVAERVPAVPKTFYNDWLNEALEASSAAVVEAVLKVKIKNSRLKVPIWEMDRAIGIGYGPAVKALIRIGKFDVNRPFFKGCALGRAVRAKSEDVALVLLQQGADPDGLMAKEPRHQPLYKAINTNNWDMVQILLDHGTTLKGHHGDRDVMLNLAKYEYDRTRSRRARKIYNQLQEVKKHQDAFELATQPAIAT